MTTLENAISRDKALIAERNANATPEYLARKAALRADRKLKKENLVKWFANKVQTTYIKPLYGDVCYMNSPLERAQKALTGRSYYVDNDTLAFFSSRISSAQTRDFGLSFYIVESVIDSSGKRGYRAVLFDIFGNVINERAKNGELARNKASAERVYWDNMCDFDLVAYYKNLFIEKAERAKKDAKVMQKLSKA